MPALLLGFAKIKDPAKLQEYSAAAVPTITAAGGSVVTRGKFKTALAGQLDIDACLIARFPSADAIQAWYQSPAYQALIAVRDQAMTPTFIVLEEPS